MEVAVFRRILKAKVHFVAIAARYLPPQSQRVHMTLAELHSWYFGEPKYVQFSRELGRARIYGSAKIGIPKAFVEMLGLRPGDLVWVRVSAEPLPLPPRPYLAKPVAVQKTQSSFYFLVSKYQVDELAYISRSSPEALVVEVSSGGRTASFEARPAPLRGKGEYRIFIPWYVVEQLRPYFYDIVHVKIYTAHG